MLMAGLPTAVVCMLLILWSGAAGAQGAMPASPDDLLRATQPGDLSTKMFSMLLGDFFSNPTSMIGGQVTVIGSMFLVFNMGVFIIGVVWAGYGLVSGIVETAEKGEVLGRRQSTIWMPIRLGIGVTGIVPVFAGFSPAQAFMVVMTTLGIGLANTMYTKGLQQLSSNASFMSTNLALPVGLGVDTKELSHTLFRIVVCKVQLEKQLAAGGSPETLSVGVPPGANGGIQVGLVSNPKLCGYAALNSVARSDTSATSYRNASVNYDGIRNQTYAAWQSGFNAMLSDVERLAVQWIAVAERYQKGDVSSSYYPEAELERAANAFQAQINQGIQSAQNTALGNTGAITQAALSNMQRDGWLGAGSWSQTWMEANAAFADAAASMQLASLAPNVENFKKLQYSMVSDKLEALVKSQDSSGTFRLASNGTSSGNFAALSSFMCSYVTSGADCDSMTNPTGNISLGQWFIVKAIKTAAVGSGGGAGVAGSELSIAPDIGLVNPIIAFKNLGDYTMTFAQGLALLKTLASDGGAATTAKEEVGGGGVFSSVASFASKIPGAGFLAKVAGSLIAGLVGMLDTMIPYLIVLGLFMAVYIPMIPFMTWMGGVVQYAVVVLQGLAGASIAALSHIDAEGEGLGQRTQAAYMFALNVTFRPALMLLGFFLATGLLVALGTIQTKLFLPAMASAQGNSMTGVLSIFGFLTLFAIVNFTLIQGLYNMVFLFPDQILGLVGVGSPNADLGRETEGKVHGVFLAGGRNLQAGIQKGADAVAIRGKTP